MTKEQFFAKWGDLSRPLKSDLDAVIAHEIAKATDQVTDQVAPPFDQDRFEAMFRAVLVGDVYVNAIKGTEDVLSQLDAYYATKKGGSNE